MINEKRIKMPKYAPILFSILIAACSGGGSNTSTPTLPAPPVAEPLPSTLLMSAWVGETSSEISFAEEAAGLEFYRSTEQSCDLANYTACENGQLDIVGADPIEDTALTLKSQAYFNFATATNQSSEIAVSSIRVDERIRHTSTAFKERLWLIGGINRDGYSAEVWSSSDGQTWRLELDDAPFGERANHSTVVYNDQLWLIGGSVPDGEPDMWSTDDGVNWVERASNAQVEAKAFSFVFLNKIMMISSNQDQSFGLWSTETGDAWQEITNTINLGLDSIHAIIPFDGKLLAIGDDGGYQSEKEIWSSTDGINWIIEADNVGDFRSANQNLVVFDDRVWLFTVGQLHYVGMSYPTGVWSSDDGKTWQEETASTEFLPNVYGTKTVFNQQLWSIGGRAIAHRPTYKVHSTSDGAHWQIETSNLTLTGEAHPDSNYCRLRTFNDSQISYCYGKTWVSKNGGEWERLPVDNSGPTRDSSHAELNGQQWRYLEGGTGESGTFSNSDDGITWTTSVQHSEFPQGGTLVALDNDLWLFGSDDSIWRFIDSAEWSKIDALVPASGSYTAFEVGGELTLFEHRLTKLWSSIDGINWESQDLALKYYRMESYHLNHIPVVFNDQLLLIAEGHGNDPDGDGKLEDQIWSLVDNELVSISPSLPFDIAIRGGYFKPFNNELYYFSVDGTWKSPNAVDWYQYFKTELTLE